MIEKSKVVCLECKTEIPKEILVKDACLIAYKCPECRINVFDKNEVEKQ